ncbi:MAG: TetR/AcrR family transcriptional regulator [Spirochaetes bacterium]|nr:MAG: TetR/AcrR family transcriptional regulator [Spirochaetota bacterium]
MKTRDRIIQAALDLFNDRGAHSVTTNHIAASMGISPGNLYYHFANKEEIIREIFERIVREFDGLYGRPADTAFSAAALLDMFSKNCDLYYAYRFFYLELATLLAQDALLRKRYNANLKKRLEQQEALYRSMQDAGILASMPPAELRASLISGWIVSDFWLTYLYIGGGRITPGRIRESVFQVYCLLKPHLAPAALAQIEKILASPR